MFANSNNGLQITAGDYVLPAYGGEFKHQQGVVFAVGSDETCCVWWDGRDDIPYVWNASDLVKMPALGTRVCVREFSTLGLMHPNIDGRVVDVKLIVERLEIRVELDNGRTVAGPVGEFEWQHGAT